LKTKILFAVFLGGALGSIARFSIFLGVEQAGVTVVAIELVATSIVNLAGAGFLGFVQSKAFRVSEILKAFWGSGFAGGFTTMSGLALITAGSELGLSEIGYLYWLMVILQFALGILAYWFIKSRFDQAKESVN
jgi:fluoride ion exporter CrcB/FEX